MKAKIGFWKVCILVFAVVLSACALNNKILIESNAEIQSDYSINGFDFRFPPKAHIRIAALQGASWQMGGDISNIIREVVNDIRKMDFEGLSSQQNSYIRIQDIKIVYQDSTPGGASSVLSVGLELQFTGQYNGAYIDSCMLGRILTDRSVPIHHGLLASRDKMRKLIQPVYEELIKEALSQALISGLNCLSKESESKQIN